MTERNIDELRQKVLEKIQLSVDDVDAIDVERWENEDKWVERFLVHSLDDVEQAASMAFDCLQWRKKMEVNAITEKLIRKDWLNAGGIYIANEDKNGNKILMFRGKLHSKDSSVLPEKKKFIIYWMEKLDKEFADKKVTVVFDMSDTGIGHMDMEIIRFIINLFKYYYPNCLAYILVFELPWILNAGWKIIKSWLSARAVDKIKFVSKTSIRDYIENEELPVVMGGSYVYEENNDLESASSSDSEPTESANAAKKKVHFANDAEKTQENDEAAEVKNNVLFDGHFKAQVMETSVNGCVLRISPSEELIFVSEQNGESTGTLYLMNNSKQCVAFKVKTTSPEKFRVRPSSGTIKPMCRADIVVQLQFAYQNSSLARDKFLIMAMEVNCEEIGNQELLDLWKQTPKDQILEHKLRCLLASPSPPNFVGTDDDVLVDSPVQKTKTNRHVPVSVNVTQELDRLHNRIRNLHRLLVVIAFMSFTILVLLLLVLSVLWRQFQVPVPGGSNSNAFCNAIDSEQSNTPPS